MGSIGLKVNTIFEILRYYEIRFQRILQITYILLSLIEIHFFKNTSSADVLILATKESKK